MCVCAAGFKVRWYLGLEEGRPQEAKGGQAVCKVRGVSKQSKGERNSAVRLQLTVTRMTSLTYLVTNCTLVNEGATVRE